LKIYLFSEFPNVILTPHIGASTLEAQERAGIEIAQAVADALNKGGIARHAIMQFALTGAWELKHAFITHTEPFHTPIVSSKDDAVS
jgi:hypothetical protein